MADFLPRSEMHLLSWLMNFGQRINAEPERFRLDPEQTVVFVALTDAFKSKLYVAQGDPMRSRSDVLVKDRAKAAVVGMARRFAAQLQAMDDLADADRVRLGLRLRWAERRRRVPPPTAAPGVRLKQILGRNAIRVQLFDPAIPNRTAKPRGVAAAALFVYVGEDRPDAKTPWTFRGQCTRTKTELAFPQTLPLGTTVWVSAQWCSPTNQRGPGTDPISTRLVGGWGVAA